MCAFPLYAQRPTPHWGGRDHIGRHSMAKRPDGSRPAALISRPAAFASSRNSVSVRSLLPSRTIISNWGSALPSGDTPPRITRRPLGRAAWAQRPKISLASLSGQSLRIDLRR